MVATTAQAKREALAALTAKSGRRLTPLALRLLGL
jgi:hypothetical protein